MENSGKRGNIKNRADRDEQVDPQEDVKKTSEEKGAEPPINN